MKRFVIACGGTGGHLSPGIALAEKLTAEGCECVLIVSRKKIDERLLEKYPNLNFLSAPGCGLSGGLFGLLNFIFEQTKSILFSFVFLLKKRPVAFISFGGFMSLGMAIASYLLFIPIVLHEANRVPGKAVRFLSRIAKRVYLPPGIHLRGITPVTARYTGFPIRKEIVKMDKDKARELLGLPINGKIISVFGGSQGAVVLSRWAKDNWKKLSQNNISIFCIVGLNSKFANDSIEDSANGPVLKFIPFCDNMSAMLSASDLVISRAGAGSIAEIIACRTPAFLIPFPFAADNHQEMNAQYFQEKGLGLKISQNDIETLTIEVEKFFANTSLAKVFQDNMEKMEKEVDWTNMVSDLIYFSSGQKSVLKTEQA